MTGRFMAQEVNFSPLQNVQVALEVHPPFYLVDRRVFSSLGVKQLGHEADCLMYLVFRVRMTGTIPLPPLCTFMWCIESLPLPLTC